MLLAINALLSVRLNKEEKESLAKAAIAKAEADFAKDCEREIEDLKDEKAILEQKKSEHSYDPPKSEIMELELAVKKAEAALEDAIDNAKSLFVKNLVDQALEGEVAKATFRVLHRLNKRDLTLEPLRPAAQKLEQAREELSEIKTDDIIDTYDARIKKIDESIAELEEMLK